MRPFHFFPMLAFFLLAGCETTRYELDAPSSAQGRKCVSRCDAVKETCYGNEFERAQQEKDRCERGKEREFRSCLSRADKKEEKQTCEKERKRDSCWVSENKQRCESNYRQCFTNCGGTVTKHTEEFHW